ncbi:MAG TPA: DUF429 domain-containing protein [Burkholderiaceae bacterium]|nr:DUF429 domain-containing protein [Burkholderiaceae bacterium]
MISAISESDTRSHPPLVGVDFTSRPTGRKPITLAFGERMGATVHVQRFGSHPCLESFAGWLCEPAQWLGAFDLPFGLPRELVEHLGWPTEWPRLIAHYGTLTREEIRRTFAAFCAARPAGSKFAHRACDGPAGSSPSMKWVNPPVAYMLHAGVPLLVAAGVSLPAVGLHADPRRVALEGYPGLLARELIGPRSYKSDEKAKQTPERLIARKEIVDGLQQGHTRLGLRLRLAPGQYKALVDDATGDKLDAVLCLMQAGWAASESRYGLPSMHDELEGWIVSA